MKNIDKYGLTLVRIYCNNGSHFGVTKEGMVAPCVNVQCKQCIFTNELSCEVARSEWLNKEAE